MARVCPRTVRMLGNHVATQAWCVLRAILAVHKRGGLVPAGARPTRAICSDDRRMPAEQHVLYHGTSWATAQLIQKQGFRPSTVGLLGPGVYIARADKASKFAANCQRHGGDSGAVVKVRITFTRPKYVEFNDNSWLSEGYDACRAERTSGSPHPEWCLKSTDQVEVLEVRPIPCGDELPAFEGEAMSLGTVRQHAASDGLYEVYFSAQLGVVSFASDAALADGSRVDVYYETGTVIDRTQRNRTALVLRKVIMSRLASILRDVANRPHSSSDACGCERHEALRKRPAWDPSRSRQWMNRHGPVGAEEAEVLVVLQQLRQATAEAEAVLKDHEERRQEQLRR
eukprot:6439555-Prymnesium_polylepis.1